MARSGRSIWDLVREASETLPEPFSHHALLTWVSERRPDVAESSIRTHINYALVETRRTGPWASKTPFLTRVDRGVYRRLGSRRPALPGAEAPGPDPRPAPDDELVASFERRIRCDVDAIQRAGYRPTVFQRMLAEHGAFEAARRLLASPQVSDGFRWLWEHQLLRLSVEHAVVAPQFTGLFTEPDRREAGRRLRDAGFALPDDG